jgi:seryl-tRNA synthetase
MIDYKLLNDSIIYYENKGFSRIETPWLVTEAVDSITRPKDIEPFIVQAKKKNLIASGEQAFLYLYLKEYLPKGKFQTVTPCFRNDSFDFTHTKYFMKNELIQTDEVTKIKLEEMVENSLTFLQSKFPIPLRIETTNDGFDIMLEDYELGSYGIRECNFLKWIYGTACAEPRTSKLINLYTR